MAGGRYPWFWAGAGAVSGCSLGMYGGWGGMVVAAAGWCLVLLVRKPFAPRRVWPFLLACLMFAGYVRVYDAWHRSSLHPLAESGTTVQAFVRIDSPVRRDGDTARFFAVLSQYALAGAVHPIRPHERVAVRLKLERQAEISQVEAWRVGDQVVGRFRLSLPEGPRNPHAFDYARYLRWQRVAVTAEAGVADVRITSKDGGMVGWFSRRQSDAARLIALSYIDPAASAYMKSLLLGVDGGVEGELAEAYADLGLIHVLAISGLHVTLVCRFFVWAGEQTGGRRRLVLTVTLVCLAAYVVLVGAGPSAVRAGVMGGIGLAAWRSHPGRACEAWGAALVAMLAANPFQLWQAGFQLSFAVTLGLILFVPVLESLPFPRTRWLRSLFAVTAAAHLTSFPFLVYWFHLASPLSWAVNLTAAPILSLLVLPLGYLALLLAAVHPALAWVPAQLAGLLLSGVHHVLLKIYLLPVPFRHWAHPSGMWLFAFGVLLIAGWAGWRLGYHRRRDAGTWLVCLAILLVWARQPFAGTDEVRITFLDVGQGDSIVVEIGRKTVYLIDGGGTVRFGRAESWREKRDPYEVGRDVLLPFLRARGKERADRLIVTHEDYDHTGGLAAVIKRMSVGTALVGGSGGTGNEPEWRQLLQARGVPFRSGSPGVTWTDSPGVTWTWLHPARGNELSDNDASVVLLLTAYGKRVLFTGDLEREGEEHLLREGRLVPVDVLKVAHHGSRTSSSAAFLAQVRPRFAVISAGRANRYGHPAPEVLERLLQNGTRVWRTDRHGAITLVIRPDGMQWTTQLAYRDIAGQALRET